MRVSGRDSSRPPSCAGGEAPEGHQQRHRQRHRQRHPYSPCRLPGPTIEGLARMRCRALAWLTTEIGCRCSFLAALNRANLPRPMHPGISRMTAIGDIARLQTASISSIHRGSLKQMYPVHPAGNRTSSRTPPNHDVLALSPGRHYQQSWKEIYALSCSSANSKSSLHRTMAKRSSETSDPYEGDLVSSNDSYPLQCYRGNLTFGWSGIHAKLNEPARDIVIESGYWESSMLSSHIYEILLREIMGYPAINRLYVGGVVTGNRLKHGVTDLSVELWQSDATYFQQMVVFEESIIYAGTINYFGHIGWYVPTWVVNQYPQYFIDFWRAFTNPNVIALFVQSGTGPRVYGPGGTPECDNVPNGCMNGTYIPKQCINNTHCAEFWASDPSYASYYNERLIDGLNLNLTIAYLEGQYLETYITAGVQPIVFYNWIPSLFVSSYNVTRIPFPYKSNCLDKFFLNRTYTPVSCDYPMDYLFKATSVEFKNEFIYPYELLERMKLNNEQINELLIQIGQTNMNDLDYGNVACQWIVENEATWSSWIPTPPVLDVEYCPVGQGKYQISNTTVCLKCSQGFYNWNPNNTDVCSACPNLATCTGGSNVTPMKDYWINPNGTTPQIIKCPETGVCWTLASNNMTSQCTDGIGGVLCCECNNPDLYKWGGECVPCPGNLPGPALVLVALGCFAFVLVIYLMPKTSGATIDIVTFYIQVAGLINEQFDFTELTSIMSINMDLSTTCVYPVKGIYKALSFFSVPPFLALCLLIVYGCNILIRRYYRRETAIYTPLKKWIDFHNSDEKEGSLLPYMIHSAFEIIMCCAIPLINTSLEILDCRQIGDVKLMYTAANTVCGVGVHFWATIFASTVIAFVLGMAPFWSLVYLYRLKTQKRLALQDEEVWHKCFYMSYRPKYYFWLPVGLIERGVILLIFVLYRSDDVYQVNVVRLLVIFLVVIIRCYTQPYRNPMEGTLSRVSALCWLTLASIDFLYIFSWQDASNPLMYFLTAILYLLPVLIVGVYYVFSGIEFIIRMIRMPKKV
ncbi:uncharacterized protein BJ171DRAFT_515971 [Polychytrium aggregatum]|uniref:uncharacterized protein n=1 Tax=Polychytrium aggregatum TaxID=110093 RepID=UPI0022FE54A7|nr:uncharacterized protein BJ171DRAFT_515971 [Polychytrium aggregatum]KAI9201933.1 hypothetical protein BJ171DRAFT_515971 [Polychytrium aggregatum]